MEISERYVELAERTSEIRRRIEAKLEQPRTEGFRGAGAFRADKLRAAVRSLREASTLVGEIPPAPPTMRARGSAFLLQLVRRALFWYTPQILRFQQIAADVAKEQLDAVDAIQREIGKLQTSIDNLRSALTAVDDEVLFRRVPSRIAPRLEKTYENSACFREYFEVLNKSGRPIQPVVDVGYGNDEWLQSLHQNGFVVHSVRSPEELGKLPSNSAAAITALDIAELIVTATVTFMADCTRVVRPGGLVILRTANSETDDLLRVLARQSFASLDVLPNGCGLIARRSE